MRKHILLPLLLLVLAASFLVYAPSAAAATNGCDGSCTGLDPSQSCGSTAQTLASMTISDQAGDWGQLDLRASLVCGSAWGRFTIFEGFHHWLNQTLGGPVVIYGRVTVWHPGGQSQGTVQSPHAAQTLGATTWSYMVNTDDTVCTGVELILMSSDQSALDSASSVLDEDSHPTLYNGEPDTRSEGWFWGPCVAVSDFPNMA